MRRLLALMVFPMSFLPLVLNWVCGSRKCQVDFHSVFFGLFFFLLFSAHKEDRHLLRRLAWEQRNQETSQAEESNCEIVPLFGEPYKVKKTFT